MTYAPASQRPRLPLSTSASEWQSTLAFFGTRLRRWIWGIMAFGLLCGALAATARIYMPSKYAATSQLLFDPRGLKIFANELTTGHFDANAAISFVESQMGVVQSERVLTRVVEAECTAMRRDAAKSGDGGIVAPTHSFTKFCPSGDAGDEGWSKALQELRRALTIKRGERSYVVDISTIGPTPELAAQLASSIVSAYISEDAATRNDAINKLTVDLAGRLENLRNEVLESEAKVEVYRRDKNLIRVGDRLLVEQRLAAATIALNESQARFDRASARVKQIEAAPRSPGALGALGAEADTRTLLALSERRNAVLVELAPLASRAGARHPGLIEVRSRLAEVDRSIAAEMSAIRSAARSDLARAKTEHANLAETLADLSEKVTRARQSEIELRTLEHEVDANRKLLDSFETRTREAREFGKIDSGNLRIVSVARAPESQRLLPKLIIFGALGLILGLIIAVTVVALSTLVSMWKRKDPPMDGGAESPPHALQMRAQAFARYRFG